MHKLKLFGLLFFTPLDVLV
ncbi:Protein of unknown function [Lactobacillus acidophilus CIRM-BIA 442]|nr:Protein of unknown function [Lactobacillus acidophilus CIRM-BIA 442]